MSRGGGISRTSTRGSPGGKRARRASPPVRSEDFRARGRESRSLASASASRGMGHREGVSPLCRERPRREAFWDKEGMGMLQGHSGESGGRAPGRLSICAPPVAAGAAHLKLCVPFPSFSTGPSSPAFLSLPPAKALPFHLGQGVLNPRIRKGRARPLPSPGKE